MLVRRPVLSMAGDTAEGCAAGTLVQLCGLGRSSACDWGLPRGSSAGSSRHCKAGLCRHTCAIISIQKACM